MDRTLPDPVDGDVQNFEFIDYGVIEVTIEDDDGAIIKETYEHIGGEVVDAPDDEGGA